VAPLPVTLIPKPYNCLYSLRQSRRLSGRVNDADSLILRSSLIVSFARMAPRRRASLEGPGGFGSVDCSIPLGLAVRLNIRSTWAALKPRDLLAKRRNSSAQIGHFLQQLHHQKLQLGRRKTVNVLGQRHAHTESDSCGLGGLENLIIVLPPRLLPPIISR
jgi:hypothetical protein